MRLLILSDIHGNLTALNQVVDYIKDIELDGLVLLGDFIDYGSHSNEVVEAVSKLEIPVLCNIRGNHEDAVLNNNYTRFSSSRGVESAKYTKSILTERTLEYLNNKTENAGKIVFQLMTKKILAVHGTFEDEYWGKFDCTKDLSAYSDYDIVFMGHSHCPFYYEVFYPSDNKATRNLKKTIFINPGSVGQPRNLNNAAQFAIFDTETENCEFIKLSYDINKEQKDFSDKVDVFYKTRLEVGI
ncbi:MAG: metallophosphoesterase family protein [Treponema sp.]|nr:metallophosphoesterase family protein [Treponema sp.]